MFSKIKSLACGTLKCLGKLVPNYTFEMNKIAGAVLLAGLIAMVSGKISGALYLPGHGHEEKRGFKVDVVEDAVAAQGGAAAPAAEEKAPDVLPLLAAASADAGKEVFKKCTACHSADKGAPNKVGPALWGVVGTVKGAHAPGFAYSAAMVEKGKAGDKWSYENLAAFLHNPKKAVPGTKMAFAGLKKPEDIANLIAFLRSSSDSPVPLP